MGFFGVYVLCVFEALLTQHTRAKYCIMGLQSKRVSCVNACCSVLQCVKVCCSVENTFFGVYTGLSCLYDRALLSV